MNAVTARNASVFAGIAKAQKSISRRKETQLSKLKPSKGELKSGMGSKEALRNK